MRQDPAHDPPEVDSPATTTITDGRSDESSPEWTDPRPLRLRRLVARVAPTLALCALIAWSWGKLQELGVRKPLQPSAPAEPVPEDMPSPLAEVAAGPDEADEDESIGDLSGVKVGAFLRTPVETWVGDGTALRPVGASMPKWKTVTLVNLWATWCEPCKRELPGLRALFAEGELAYGWGPETRFVALMVDDNVTARAARREYVDEMPTGAVFLVDRGLDGGVKSKLAGAPIGAAERAKRGITETTLLPEDANLPVTLLLDCRRRVRWHHVGVLEGPDFDEITARIAELRKELDTDRCRPRSRRGETPEHPPLLGHATRESEPEATAPASEPEVAAGAEPGPTNGPPPDRHAARSAKPVAPRIALGPKCDRRPGASGDGRCNCRTEDCSTAPQDCGCYPEATCRPQQKGPARCVENRLTDTRSAVVSRTEEDR